MIHNSSFLFMFCSVLLTRPRVYMYQDTVQVLRLSERGEV